MKFRGFLALLILLLGSALSSQAQEMGSNMNSMTYTISGHVRDTATGQPVNDIRVELMRGGVALENDFTRNNGNFQFLNIPSGEYVVEVNADGYATADENVDISTAPVYDATIDLHRLPGNSSGGPAGAISAHELSVPPKARDAYAKGLGLLHSNPDYKAAIVMFERAIQIFPGYYEAYSAEGACNMQLGDAPSAEKAARKSMELSSGKYPQAIFLLASILNKDGRFTEAEAAARQAIALDATAWQGHFELGHALSALNRPQEAEAEAIHARDANPANPRAYLLLANIHMQLENNAAELQDLNGYLKVGPPGPQTDAVRKARDQMQKNIQNAQAEPKPEAEPDKP